MDGIWKKFVMEQNIKVLAASGLGARAGFGMHFAPQLS